MRWHSLVCVKTLVFWGYLNTLNSSWLLPTNWNKRRPKISGTRMPSLPLSVYHQLFTQCIWNGSPQFFNFNLSIPVQIISGILVIARWATNGCSHQQTAMYQPNHSIHFSSRPLECPQFRRFPPSPKSPTTKETKPIKRRPTLQSKKVLSVYYHSILQEISVTEVLTQTDVEDSSIIVGTDILKWFGRLYGCLEGENIFSRLNFWSKWRTICHRLKVLIQTIHVRNLADWVPWKTLPYIRLRKENKSNFVPIEVVKKMLRSQNFTQSCLLSNVFCWNFHICPFDFLFTFHESTCDNICRG